MSKHPRKATMPPTVRLMTGRVRNLLLAFTLLGLVASAVSTYVHHRLLTETEYLSFCDVNATVSCTTVYLSRFGSIGGVPVALVGTVWFGLLLLLLLAERLGPATYRESVPLYLFALSGIALVPTVYLAYVSWFVLGAVCILCGLVYVAVAGIFVVSGASTPFSMASLPTRVARDFQEIGRRPVVALVSVMFLGGATLAMGFFAQDASTTEPDPVAPAAALAPALTDGQQTEFEGWYAAQPRIEVPVDGEGAALVIVKFNDYQCPPCRQTFFNYRDIVARYQEQYPGDVVFVTKDYPLDPECNENVATGLHTAACEAAVAVRLAREGGKAELMEEWLFENQASLSPAAIREAVRDVAGVETFDVDYDATLELVKADIALGRRLGVQATPTFFVNGVKVQGGLERPYFDLALALELKRVGR